MTHLICKTLIASASALLACGALAPAFAADWPSGYTRCAAEQETCAVGATKRKVSYGAANKWVTKTLSGNVACNNGTFGDPISGIQKYCAVAPLTPTPTPTPPPTPTPIPTPTPAVDQGSSTTAWASGCATTKPETTPGTWVAGGPSPDRANYKLVKESAHFAFYSDEKISDANLTLAVNTLENTVWHNLFNANLFMPEPFVNTPNKIKPSIHIHSTDGLTAGGWARDRIGMWIGPGALLDHWGLTHEFTHAWQSWWMSNGGLNCTDPNNCRAIAEGHANYTAHQLPEYKNEAHCSEMLANAPHLYLGSSRDQYCNWQYMEYLKDKQCPAAVSQIFTTPGSDTFANIQKSRGWSVSQLNDFFGDWAMHNVVWDYKATPAAFRNSFGNITQTDKSECMHRLMPLEALDTGWAANRRFVSPYYGAPQRFGYNVVRLYPAAGASTVSVKFRGVNQAGSNADYRWGLVATNAQFTSARYSAMQKGLDANLTFAVKAGEPLFMVVTATPSVLQVINGEQDYAGIWRYPYMIEVANAWPQGFQNGQRDPCPAGTGRHANGGGCAPSTTSASAYVGPYATVLPGNSVTGNARIEDQAIVANGSVSGGTVGGLSIIGERGNNGDNAFTVGGAAQVRTTFYPLGFFERGQAASGSLNLYGDVEYRGEGLNLSAGNRSGFVDAESRVGSALDINTKVRPLWRP
ncbi:DUF6055 domain-containing protein [Massilia aquatica]|uniref:DUF6055 domain-containing protein n=1 Tax=Massilia aquatica TaxID=2609000 RepID=UPI00165231EE|nr:DUF6055 domain-containing protein [Massilia aquatica]